MLAGVITDDLEMDSQWQIMDKAALEKLKAGEWGVVHPVNKWHPQMDTTSPTEAVTIASVDLDL